MDQQDEKELQGEFVLNPSSRIPPQESGIEKALKKKGNVRFYSSLSINPEGARFENQESDEKLVLLARRDLITNVPWILGALALIFLPPILFVFSDLFSPFIQISEITLFVIMLFYYLIIFGFIIVQFTLWYFNIGLVTTKRIIDIDVSGILYKHISETRLNIVEDVSFSQVGSVRSFFNYGDVYIQTAGTLSNFEFERVPEPQKIVRIIADMIGGAR